MTPEHKKALQEGRAAAAEKRKKDKEQELVRTNSAQIREAKNGSPRSLEEVAARHAHEEDDDGPTPEEIAAATQVYNQDDEAYSVDDAVPPDEPDPMVRDKATVGVIQPLRDESDGELRTLRDLMNEYGLAIDLGTAYIHVERKYPLAFEGARIRGVQAPIKQQMTQEEFNDFYGYGKYELIVYGPSRKHGYKWDAKTGVLKYRQLTQPITIEVPAGYPVNPAAVFQEEEDNMSRDLQGAGRVHLRPLRGATTADAKIHETDLTFEEKDKERQRSDARERQQQEDRQRAEQERMISRLLEQNREAHEKQMAQQQEFHDRQMAQLERTHEVQIAAIRTDMERLERELEAERHSDKKSDGEVLVTAMGQTLGQILPALQRSDALTGEQRISIERAAAEDKQRLTDTHREEIRRLENTIRDNDVRWREQIEGERRRAEDRSREDRQLADTRMREIEQRAADQVNAAKTDAAKQLEELRRDFDKRLSDQRTMYEDRIQQIDRTHQRDLSAKEDHFTTRIETVRSTHQSELLLKDSELERLRSDLAEARDEARKPLVERIREREEEAEALGYSKSDGSDEPKDWKQMIPEIGMQLVQNLPGVLDTVNRTMDARRGVPPQQQARQLPSGQPMHTNTGLRRPVQQALPFASEDSDLNYDYDDGQTDPIYPHAEPPGPSRRPVPVQHPASPGSDEAPPMATMPPPPSSPPPAPPAPRAPPAPPPRAPARAAPAPAPQEQQISDEQILQYSSMFKDAFQQGASAEEFVEYVKTQLNPQLIQSVSRMVSPEQIIEVLEERDSANPLLRRDGQKFLRDVWDLISE